MQVAWHTYAHSSSIEPNGGTRYVQIVFLQTIHHDIEGFKNYQPEIYKLTNLSAIATSNFTKHTTSMKDAKRCKTAQRTRLDKPSGHMNSNAIRTNRAMPSNHIHTTQNAYITAGRIRPNSTVDRRKFNSPLKEDYEHFNQKLQVRPVDDIPIAFDLGQVCTIGQLRDDENVAIDILLGESDISKPPLKSKLESHMNVKPAIVPKDYDTTPRQRQSSSKSKVIAKKRLSKDIPSYEEVIKGKSLFSPLDLSTERFLPSTQQDKEIAPNILAENDADLLASEISFLKQKLELSEAELRIEKKSKVFVEEQLQAERKRLILLNQATVKIQQLPKDDNSSVCGATSIDLLTARGINEEQAKSKIPTYPVLSLPSPRVRTSCMPQRIDFLKSDNTNSRASPYLQDITIKDDKSIRKLDTCADIEILCQDKEHDQVQKLSLMNSRVLTKVDALSSSNALDHIVCEDSISSMETELVHHAKSPDMSPANLARTNTKIATNSSSAQTDFPPFDQRNIEASNSNDTPNKNDCKSCKNCHSPKSTHCEIKIQIMPNYIDPLASHTSPLYQQFLSTKNMGALRSDNEVHNIVIPKHRDCNSSSPVEFLSQHAPPFSAPLIDPLNTPNSEGSATTTHDHNALLKAQENLSFCTEDMNAKALLLNRPSMPSNRHQNSASKDFNLDSNANFKSDATLISECKYQPTSVNLPDTKIKMNETHGQELYVDSTNNITMNKQYYEGVDFPNQASNATLNPNKVENAHQSSQLKAHKEANTNLKFNAQNLAPSDKNRIERCQLQAVKKDLDARLEINGASGTLVDDVLKTNVTRLMIDKDSATQMLNTSVNANASTAAIALMETTLHEKNLDGSFTYIPDETKKNELVVDAMNSLGSTTETLHSVRSPQINNVQIEKAISFENDNAINLNAPQSSSDDVHSLSSSKHSNFSVDVDVFKKLEDKIDIGVQESTIRSVNNIVPLKSVEEVLRASEQFSLVSLNTSPLPGAVKSLCSIQEPLQDSMYFEQPNTNTLSEEKLTFNCNLILNNALDNIVQHEISTPILSKKSERSEIGIKQVCQAGHSMHLQTKAQISIPEYTVNNSVREPTAVSSILEENLAEAIVPQSSASIENTFGPTDAKRNTVLDPLNTLPKMPSTAIIAAESKISSINIKESSEDVVVPPTVYQGPELNLNSDGTTHCPKEIEHNTIANTNTLSTSVNKTSLLNDSIVLPVVNTSKEDNRLPNDSAFQQERSAPILSKSQSPRLPIYDITQENTATQNTTKHNESVSTVTLENCTAAKAEASFSVDANINSTIAIHLKSHEVDEDAPNSTRLRASIPISSKNFDYVIPTELGNIEGDLVECKNSSRSLGQDDSKHIYKTNNVSSSSSRNSVSDSEAYSSSDNEAPSDVTDDAFCIIPDNHSADDHTSRPNMVSYEPASPDMLRTTINPSSATFLVDAVDATMISDDDSSSDYSSSEDTMYSSTEHSVPSSISSTGSYSSSSSFSNSAYSSSED